MKKNHRALAYLYLFITAAIWGFAGPVIKFTLAYFPPSVFITYRFAISTLVALLMLAFTSKNISKNTKQLPQLLLYGFLTSTAAIGLVFIGFDKTTALTGSIFGALTPIITTVAGVFLLHEHVTGREKIGIGLALLGTVFMILEPLIFGGTVGIPVSFEGNMYHIAALLVTVLTAVMAKVILRNTLDPLTLTHLSFTVGFATMLPITLANHTPTEIISLIRNAPIQGHAGVLYMALLSGTAAYTFWHIGIKTIEVGEASLFTYLYPIFAAPLSLLWLKEPITPVFILSTLVIAAGVLVAEYKKSLLDITVLQTKRRRKRFKMIY